MSNNLKKKNVVLIGVGNMGRHYFKLLQALGIVPMAVVGRSALGVKQFSQDVGFIANRQSNMNWKKFNLNEAYGIVAVDIESTCEVAYQLIQMGMKKILLEKPGALTFQQSKHLTALADREKAKVFIGYNRRFYASVQRVQQFIKEDGGLLSISFEFTEWINLIPADIKSSLIKKFLVIANSSHVIDLSFFLAGKPVRFNVLTSGGKKISWHPSASIFCGTGITDKNVLFSYHSNWLAPGRWGIECLTSRHRLLLRPLEKLQYQKKNSVSWMDCPVDDVLDRDFKPGLFKQTVAFLKDQSGDLKTLKAQQNDLSIYSRMANY